MEEKIEIKNDDKNDKWIFLNVGGTIMVTSKSTILTDENSVLAKMFSNNFWKSADLDKDGNFILDRDARYFGVLLNFLRSGQVFLDNNIDIRGVLEEAEYWNVKSMVDIVLKKMKTPDLSRKEFILNSVHLENDFSKFETSKHRFNKNDVAFNQISQIKFIKRNF